MDFHFLSVADFNNRQTILQEELKQLERWVVENRLDQLSFARNRTAYTYYSAATFFSPEQSDAGMSWTKNGILVTVIDDFFDEQGSIAELENLIQLVEKWDVEDVSTKCTSQSVEIIFSALKGTICEVADKAVIRQGRCLRNHIINIWLDVLHAMIKETKWARDNYLPKLEEYMSNACISFALGPIILPALYLLGPKLPEELDNHPELHNLLKLTSTCGRLLNDIQSWEREMKQGKPNAVLLYTINSDDGSITREDAIEAIKRLMENPRRELLQLVFDGGNKSAIPKPFKDLFWHTSTICHSIYSKDDGFTLEDFIKTVNSVIHEPIVHKNFKDSETTLDQCKHFDRVCA